MLRYSKLFATSIALLAFACNAQNFSGKSSTKNKADGSRPSEQGEGVVGYLTDPKAVNYQEHAGKLTVSGGAGAVKSDAGSVDGLPICLQQISKADLATIVGASGKFAGASVTNLATGSVQADGSFAMSVDSTAVDKEKLIALDASGACASGTEPNLDQSGKSLVFKDPADQSTFGGSADYTATTSVEPDLSALCFQKDDASCDQVVSFDVIDADSGAAIPSFKADFTEASTSAYVGTESLAPGDKMKYQSADYYVSITASDFIDTQVKILKGEPFKDVVKMTHK